MMYSSTSWLVGWLGAPSLDRSVKDIKLLLEASGKLVLMGKCFLLFLSFFFLGKNKK